jgi:hypothetical protein
MPGYQRILELFDDWDTRDVAIPFSELVEAMRGLDLERADFAGALVFADRNYRRIAIRRRPHYEALVLCWKAARPRQATFPVAAASWCHSGRGRLRPAV